MSNSSIESDSGPSFESPGPANDIELFDREMTSETVRTMIAFEDTLAAFLDAFAQSFEEPNDMTRTARVKQLTEPLARTFAEYASNLETETDESHETRVDYITELALYAEQKRIAIYQHIAFCLDYPKLAYGPTRTRADIDYCLTESEKVERHHQKEQLLGALANWFTVCIQIELKHTSDHMPGR